MKLSLGVIVKDERKEVERIISNYGKYFDELVFAVDDETLLDIKGDKVFVYLYEKSKEELDFSSKFETPRIFFDRKRNFLASKITGDWYVRIDTDDTIENPEFLREVAEKSHNDGTSLVVCKYDYSKDPDNNVNAQHLRETIIKNDSNLYWNKPIHECIIPKSPANYKVKREDRINITHHKSFDEGRKALLRNLEYLIYEYNRDKEKTDPRTFAYLGRTFYPLQDYDKAIFFLQKHIESSGWDEDRYFSWCVLADCYIQKKDLNTAIACANEALQEMPTLPDAYFKLHDIYFHKEQWQKAVDWGNMGFSKKVPTSFMVTDPSSCTWRPAISMAFCLLRLDKIEESLKMFGYAKKLAPNLKWIKENEPMFKEAMLHKKFNTTFIEMYKLIKANEPEKIPSLIASVPKQFLEDDIVISITNANTMRTWGKKEVAILCPIAVEEWDATSVKDGIGGSEEAAIRLAEQFQNLGYKVTVFNEVKKEGVYNGVRYLSWKKFNKNDVYNILISWRVNIFYTDVKAQNRIIWLHDLPNCLEGITDDEVLGFDKVVVLSEYHKSLLPKNIPNEKIHISTNGIVPEDFIEVRKKIAKRKKNRIIYASSYDRGLEIILKNWSKVRKAIPDAELHCFYGWNSYDEMMKIGSRTPTDKIRITELMKQDGVFEHGRVGHKQLLEEYYKSEFFAYPGTFAGEINCIALTKALACGCKCITNDMFVLPERNPHVVATNDNFIDKLIAMMQGSLKTKSIDEFEYIKNNSWLNVAKDWQRNVFPTELPVEYSDRITWVRKNCNPLEKIIDIGSNKGHTFEGWDRDNITSVDLDTYDIKNFVKASAEALPFKDNTFDISVMCEVLEHCPNPVTALKEAARVGRRVLITVPNEHKWAKSLRPFTPIEKEMERTGQSQEELAKFGNPTAKEFHTEDGYKHLYHNTFYNTSLLRKHLKKAGYDNYELIELRNDKWVWICVIANTENYGKEVSNDMPVKRAAVSVS